LQVDIISDTQIRHRAERRAAELGLSLRESIEGLVTRDVESAEASPSQPPADVSIIFDLIDEGEPTDITRDEDRLI